MSIARVAPHALDAEAAVLSAVLLEQRSLDELAGALRADQFYSEANRRIYEAALDLAQNGQIVDVVTVAGWLRSHERLTQIGGSAYLAQLVDAVPSVANIGTYARLVREKWRVRELIKTCQRIAAEGYGEIGDVQEFVDQAEQAVYELSRVERTTTMRRLGEWQRDALGRIVDAAARGQRLTGIPTGFTRLDVMLSGLHDGELTIIAARPGMGKSGLASAIAINVASWDGDTVIGVAFFSVEMPGEQIAIRAVCSEARVSVGRVRAGYISDADWNSLTPAASKIHGVDVWLDDRSHLNVLEIRAEVRRLQAEYDLPASDNTKPRKIGLVIVDYLQLMSGVADHSNREQEVAEISRGLKRLAKELRVPVIALAQLNRAVETRGKDKRPQLSDLRESGSVEQDADNVIFIYREEYYNEDTDAKGIAELVIAKQRNGPTGTVKVKFTGEHTRFDNLAPGEYPEEDTAA